MTTYYETFSHEVNAAEEHKRATIGLINRSTYLFRFYDHVTEWQGKGYKLTAIHGYDQSTRDAYEAHPDTVRVSLKALDGSGQTKTHLKPGHTFDLVPVE